MMTFIKVSENFKPDCSDGTKCCFMFSSYDKVDDFMAKLKKRINADVKEGSYIGNKTIYVPVEKYKEAVLEGLNIILNDKSYETSGISFVNCYDEKIPYEYEHILFMGVSDEFLNDKGFWTKKTKFKIQNWKERLEKILNTEVLLLERCGMAKFYIKRTTPEEHEDILNKIRKSTLFESAPFEKYALVDYYGEFIEI